MTSPIVIDLTRLCVGAAWRSPRGIDRVDLAYAHHFLNLWKGDCGATMLTPWGAQYLNRARAVELLESAQAAWQEGRPQAGFDGSALDKLLAQSTLSKEGYRKLKRDSRVFDAVRSVIGNARLVGASAVKKVPENAIYVNTGQIGIADNRLLGWLRKRSDIKPVFMLHDTIPLDFPEFVPALSNHYHRQMLRNTARYRAQLISTTATARNDICRELRAEGYTPRHTIAADLPPSAEFEAARDYKIRPDRSPYFVVCGSIEPRKNHMLLFNIWRELYREYGVATPRLYVVGSRWSAKSDSLRFLEMNSILRPFLIHIGGLPTYALAKLIAGARALLMPSFAEGFGLPIVEALAAGTPVIASNIPAHLEAGGPRATYLSPIDGPRWKAAIEDHVTNFHGHRTKAMAYKPSNWETYFTRIESFLASLH